MKGDGFMLTDVVIANKSYTKFNVPVGESVDEIVLRVIKQDCPGFLLPISTMELDGEREIRYELSEGARLRYNYDSSSKMMKMTKKDFTVLLENMLSPFKICGDWFLDYHNILLDLDYILISKKDYAVKYLYLPIMKRIHTEAEVHDFFNKILLKAEIVDDAQYTMELMRILGGDDANLMTLLQYIQREGMRNDPGLSGENDASGIAMPRKAEELRGKGISRVTGGGETEEKVQRETDVNLTGAGTRPGNAIEEFGRQNLQGELAKKLFDDSSEDVRQGKALKEGKGKSKPGREQKENSTKENRVKERTGLLGFLGKSKDGKPEQTGNCQTRSEEKVRTGENVRFWQHPGAAGEDETEIGDVDNGNSSGSEILRLELVESGGYHCPKMVELDMGNGFITVGRLDKNGQAHSDYCFDSSLTIISRRHFLVEKIDKQWMITDLGGGNGTYVDGELLAPNIRRCLQEGNCIMIRKRDGSKRIVYRVC